MGEKPDSLNNLAKRKYGKKFIVQLVIALLSPLAMLSRELRKKEGKKWEREGSMADKLLHFHTDRTQTTLVVGVR